MRAVIVGAALLVPAAVQAQPEELALGGAAVTQEGGELQLTAGSDWQSDDGRSRWSVSGDVEYGISDDVQLAIEGARDLDVMEGSWALEGSLLARAAGGRRWRLVAGAAISVEAEGADAEVAIEPTIAASATRGRWGVNLAATATAPPDRPRDAEASVALAVFASWPRVTPVIEVALSGGARAPSMRWAAGVELTLDPAAIIVGVYRAEAEGGLGGRVVLSWDLALAEGDER